MTYCVAKIKISKSAFFSRILNFKLIYVDGKTLVEPKGVEETRRQLRNQKEIFIYIKVGQG